MESKFLTTGIGSLPHHNVDSAIDYSFKYDIPYLPQLPALNENEYMIQQALQNLPGVMVTDEHIVQVDLKVWLKGKDQYQAILNSAVQSQNYQSFLPRREYYSCWPAFLFELEEKKPAVGKLQIAGPLTCQVVTKLTDGESIVEYADLLSQIYQSVFCHAQAMVSAIKELGVRPLIFIDEPGLYAYNEIRPVHLTAINELQLMIKALKNQGAQVGLHCCAQTHWDKVLKLSLDYLSFDFSLSAREIFSHSNLLSAFIERGGALAMGIVPTHFNQQLGPEASVQMLEVEIENLLGPQNSNQHMKFFKKYLKNAILTPACGLAFKSPKDAEYILAQLQQFKRHFLLQ